MFTHAYCENCQAIIKVFQEPRIAPSICGKFVGGDIVCEDCFNVIATVFNQADATTLVLG